MHDSQYNITLVHGIHTGRTQTKVEVLNTRIMLWCITIVDSSIVPIRGINLPV